MTARTRVGVLISGSGSNMAALADAARGADAPFEIALVLSNRPGAGGLAIAREKGLPAEVVDHRRFGADREGHERALDAVLNTASRSSLWRATCAC